MFNIIIKHVDNKKKVQNKFYHHYKTKKVPLTNGNCFSPKLNVEIVSHRPLGSKGTADQMLLKHCRLFRGLVNFLVYQGSFPMIFQNLFN